MATLKAPSLTLEFTEKAASVIERGTRGIVALVLRDATATSKEKIITVRDVTDVPSDLSAANQQHIKDALIGYNSAPSKVIVYIMSAAEENKDTLYTDMMEYFETENFQWMAIPTVKTDGKASDVASWVKTQRENGNMIKAVLPELDSADCEGVINWVSTLYKVSDGETTTYAPEQTTPRIAGLLAGTDTTISATYAPLKDFDDVDRMRKSEMDTAVGAGKLFAFWDGEKVKLNRAVTSFTTATGTKGDSFKKIKLVEDMDIIKTDIQTILQDSYIGKYSNSYDNKCLMITAVNVYFQTLATAGTIESGSIEIDVAAQRNYLVSLGKDVTVGSETKKPTDLSDDEVKKANTGSHVFLKATVVLLDAIEDVDIQITI